MLKRKFNKNCLFSIIGCIALAFITCFSFLIPKTKTINSASAYVAPSLSPTQIVPDSYYPDPLVSPPEDSFLYSSFLSYNLDPRFSNNLQSGVNYYIEIFANFISSDISDDFNSVNVTPTSDFDYITFIRDYFDTYENICNQDKNKFLYLQFAFAGLESSSSFSSRKIVFVNKKTGIIDYTIDFANYDNTTQLVNQESAITPHFMLDLMWISNHFNMSVYDFLDTYIISYSFKPGSNMTLTSYLPMFGISYTPYRSRNMLSCLNQSYSPLSYVYPYSSVNSLSSYYYMFSGNSLNDYWRTYYNDYYSKDLQSKLDNSYNNGYNTGFSKGSEETSQLPAVILSFASLPFSILGGFLDFEIFGFNIYNVILAFITLLLCIWVIKQVK